MSRNKKGSGFCVCEPTLDWRLFLAQWVHHSTGFWNSFNGNKLNKQGGRNLVPSEFVGENIMHGTVQEYIPVKNLEKRVQIGAGR
jgi:hypothetical protein